MKFISIEINCIPGCWNGGTCSGSNVCTCVTGYEGDRCESRKRTTEMIEDRMAIFVVNIIFQLFVIKHAFMVDARSPTYVSVNLVGTEHPVINVSLSFGTVSINIIRRFFKRFVQSHASMEIALVLTSAGMFII